MTAFTGRKDGGVGLPFGGKLNRVAGPLHSRLADLGTGM